MDQSSVFIRKGTTYVFPDSACMLATDVTGALILVEQFRKSRATRTLELPGGVVRPEETPAAAAIREFEEETALRVNESRLVFTLDLDFSTALHRTHVFTSMMCEPMPGRVAEFQVRRLRLHEVLDGVQNGTITHAPTVAATLAMVLENRPEIDRG